jgi:hypothetical protein
MSDDRKRDDTSLPPGQPQVEREADPGEAVPFLPFVRQRAALRAAQQRQSQREAANMSAIRAAQRRKASAAALANSGSGDSTPLVLQQPPDQPRSVISPGPHGAAAFAGAGRFAPDATVLSAWASVRPEVMAKLEAIEAGLRAIAPVIQSFDTAYRERARIGHNNPPEDIDFLPIGLAEVELGIVAATVARTEISTEHPRPDIMGLCGLVLRWTGELLSACVKWVGAKADKFVDALIPLAAAGLVAKFTILDGDITVVVNKIRHVLELLNVPF